MRWASARSPSGTRYLTVGIALLQSTSFAFLFHSGALVGGIDLLPNFTVWAVFVVVLTLTTGTALLMWMGELITQRGIGNGMSLLIFTSVVSALPAQITAVRANNGNDALVGFIVVAVILMVCIVFVEQGQRRIPVQFAKRVVGRRMYGGQSTYIPLKVNQSGVIPIIFASSVLYPAHPDRRGHARRRHRPHHQGLRQRPPHLSDQPGVHVLLRPDDHRIPRTSTRPSPSTR